MLKDQADDTDGYLYDSDIVPDSAWTKSPFRHDFGLPWRDMLESDC